MIEYSPEGLYQYVHGMNPMSFASPEVAKSLAQLLGGVANFEQNSPTAGPYQWPDRAGVTINGQPFNAGYLSGQLTQYDPGTFTNMMRDFIPGWEPPQQLKDWWASGGGNKGGNPSDPSAVNVAAGRPAMQFQAPTQPYATTPPELGGDLFNYTPAAAGQPANLSTTSAPQTPQNAPFYWPEGKNSEGLLEILKLFGGLTGGGQGQQTAGQTGYSSPVVGATQPLQTAFSLGGRR